MKTYLFPGQGSQHVGMGEELFDAFPELTSTADDILGYSIKTLCTQDPNQQLGQTQYTQPALYVVNALSYRQQFNTDGVKPDFVAGHSLGEYNALECAGVFSFDEGVRLVKKRGELMSTAPKGSMAAIIGIPSDKIAAILNDNGINAIDIANYNAKSQTIISGLEADIQSVQSYFEQEQAMFIPLNVSGAFHSRYMQPIQDEFSHFLNDFTFAEAKIPVIANIHARPYQSAQTSHNLAEQLTHSVRWLESMHYLLQQGEMEFTELGPGDVLSKLIHGIKSQFKPDVRPVSTNHETVTSSATQPETIAKQSPQQQVDNWNLNHAIGTRVKVKGYSESLTTKTQAVVLFGHRAAIYMQGYNGYFALADIESA